MGTTQKYSLRWNDFSLNVATTFRDLHSQHVSKYILSGGAIYYFVWWNCVYLMEFCNEKLECWMKMMLLIDMESDFGTLTWSSLPALLDDGKDFEFKHQRQWERVLPRCVSSVGCPVWRTRATAETRAWLSPTWPAQAGDNHQSTQPTLSTLSTPDNPTMKSNILIEIFLLLVKCTLSLLSLSYCFNSITDSPVHSCQLRWKNSHFCWIVWNPLILISVCIVKLNCG